MWQLTIHTHNIESCYDILVTPREILVAQGLQSQECKLLELIFRICVFTMNLLYPRGFSLFTFLLVIVLRNEFYLRTSCKEHF
jgi:hypothetical protein